MTAKNKDDFLFQLHNELHRIGVDDNEEIFADFEEHFRASAEQGCTEEETCEKLGDVKEIARSYVDIESTAINSMLANAIEDARPHVSLTKPGRDYPASVPLPVEQSEPVREFTPEHIAEEQAAPSQPISSVSGAPAVDFQRSVSPTHIAPEQPKAEPQPAPAPQQTRQDTSHQAEIPPQPNAAKTSGEGSFRFSDIKGLQPNLNVSKLVVQIILDIFLYSWLVPMLVSITCWIFFSGVAGLVGSIFSAAAPFFLISKIFLIVALGSLTVLMVLFGIQMVKWIISLIKHIVIAHIKAVYDL